MKAVAFWSELSFPKDPSSGRQSWSYVVTNRDDLQELVAKYGTPNLIHIVDGPTADKDVGDTDGPQLVEGRDWTRRERTGVPACFDDVLELFPAR